MTWTVRRLVVLALVVGAVTAWLSPWRADAATGCQQAHAVIHSPLARACRNDGWHVRRWIVVRPDRTVAYLGGSRFLCPTEDSNRCVWLAYEQGNGRGQSFWADRHGHTHRLLTRPN